jgi:hypothetical protein
MAALPDSPASSIQMRRRWWALADVGLIFLLFFLYAGWSPPDVNEAHYLAKAKHFWNPDWCPHDHFLESADAHAVFYWTVGWLTLYVSLPAVAWIGRITTWLLLAWGWRRLSFALVPRPLYAVLSAALWLCFLSRGHMAGEWVVGGIEAKCLAYVLVFFGLAELVSGRWSATWLLFGAASAFHVIVGGWCVVAGGVAWLCAGKNRPPLMHMVPALVAGGLLALPGLVTALLLNHGVGEETVREATEIYVFQRLDHHLVLQKIRVGYVARFIGMSVVCVVLYRWLPKAARLRRLGGFVWGALLIAIAGAVIELVLLGNRPVTATLMRFYWYRLADVAVPVGLALSVIVAVITVERRLLKTISQGRQVTFYWQPLSGVHVPVGLAVSAAATVARLLEEIRRTVPPWMLAAAMLLAGVSLGESYVSNFLYRTGDSKHVNWHKKHADWRAICDWIDGHLPADERFLTPRLQETFKWYAGRSEVFSRKDIPQDARGIVEWDQRYHDIFRTKSEVPGSRWRRSLATIDIETLRELADKYDFRYVVVDRTVIDPKGYHPHVIPVAENDSFTVFRLRDATGTNDRRAPADLP